MNAHPDWLPGLVSVDPWRNDTYELLYRVFRCDLLQRKLTYRGHNVWFYPETEEEGKESIFWHLTTRTDYNTTPPDRFPDLERCRRLSWVATMILRCPCPTGDIRDWDHEEGNGDIKTYIWLYQHDFVIILKKLRDGRRRLLTSFHLDGPHEVRKIEKKWERRL